MPYGLRCKNCGWQETEHEHADTSVEEEYGKEEVNKVYSSRTHSLKTCPGYELTPEDEAERRRLRKKYDKEDEEREKAKSRRIFF